MTEEFLRDQATNQLADGRELTLQASLNELEPRRFMVVNGPRGAIPPSPVPKESCSRAGCLRLGPTGPRVAGL